MYLLGRVLTIPRGDVNVQNKRIVKNIDLTYDTIMQVHRENNFIFHYPSIPQLTKVIFNNFVS